MYGDDCKLLQRLAIRVLSLTCSATGCERNWSTFDQIHSKRRNRLEQQRLNALVFVKYNMQLGMRQKMRAEKGETYDPICLSDMESDDEWITEREDPCLDEDDSWLDIHECFNVDEGAPTNKRKRGPRNLNANPKDKGKGKQKEVEEDIRELEDEDDDDDEEEDVVMLQDDDDDDDDGDDDDIDLNQEDY